MTMANKIRIQLIDHVNQSRVDLEVDPEITAIELFTGLNNALGWGNDLQNSSCCYLSCENPIALLRGDHTLQEFGVRNASTIHYIRH